MHVLLYLLLALTVKEDHSPLRSGCASDSAIVATLPAGTSLTIRFAMSGEDTPCYKVAASVDGKDIDGYLSAAAIDGLDGFDKGRREAAFVDTAQMVQVLHPWAPKQAEASPASSNALVHTSADPALLQQAVRLIQTSQPGKALAILEPELHRKPDAVLLEIAGEAAWLSDDSARALEYWKSSLDMRADPDLDRLYQRVQRETRNDQSTEKLYGVRVVLRYDRSAVTSDAARQMLGAVDETFASVAQLGCNAEEKIVTIVQSRDAYKKATDAAEWSGGQFDGRIRVPVLDGQGMDATMRRTLAHETTHACLSMLGHWPAWMQEGMAQKLSGDTLSPMMKQKLAQMAREGSLPRLGNLRQDWSRLDTQHAAAAYALALEAIDQFYQAHGNDAMRNLLRNPDQLPTVTAELNKDLGL